jgi:hypothetical protein
MEARREAAMNTLFVTLGAYQLLKWVFKLGNGVFFREPAYKNGIDYERLGQ